MESIVKKRELWLALSDLFIDNEINYSAIARKTQHYSLNIIEHSLFYEVAPICSPNLSRSIPVVWSFFEIDIIAPLIEEHILRYNNKKLYKIKVDFLVNYYKFQYKLEWMKLQKEIILFKDH